MSLQSWLRRWDRRNQSALSGHIPEDMRERWVWQRRVDDRGRTVLMLPGSVTLSDEGVSGRLLRADIWPWARVAYLSWDAVQYSACLAVCVRGDPYVHSLNFCHRDDRVCRALLDDCRVFVEAHGAKVRSTIDSATLWWVHQPEARQPDT